MSLTRTGIKRLYSRLTQQSQKEWQESQKESQPSTKKKKKPETQIFTKEETTKKIFQNLLGMKVFKRCGRVSKESHKTYKHVRESQM